MSNSPFLTRLGNLRTSRPRGVALMEVLVSTAIIGAGFGTFLWSLSSCARSQSALNERETGRFLAERQLLFLRQHSLASQTKDMTGDFAAPCEDYSWKAVFESPADTAPFVIVCLTVFQHVPGASETRPTYSLRTILNVGG